MRFLKINRAVNAGSWVVFGLVTSQLIKLLSNLFLTRFLMPEAFGLLAISFTLISGIHMLSNVGLQLNIVRSFNAENPTFLMTAWTVAIIRGACICLLVIALGFSVHCLNAFDLLSEDSVYSNPMLPWVIVALSAQPLIGGFLSVNFHVAERNIDQKGRALIELFSSVLPVPFMAIMILFTPTVWVLILGTIFSEVVRVSGSHWVFGGSENRLRLDREVVKELLNFGKWVMLSSLLGFLALQGDKLMLAGYFSGSLMGCYAIATLFIISADKLIRRLQSSIAYPLIAEKYREGGNGFVEVYYRFRKWMDPVVISIGVGLTILGDELIRLLYTDEYLDAGWMLNILGVQVLLLIYAMQEQIFLVLGRPKLISYASFVRAVTLLVCLPIAIADVGVRLGVWVVVLAPLPGIALYFYYLQKAQLVYFKKELRVLPIVVVAIIVSLLIEAGLNYSIKLFLN